MKKFISWRRVSTKKQGASGLGLEAQKELIRYFVEKEQGILLDDYEEVYSGTDLANCSALKAAIKACKEQDAILIIAKTDRLRNTVEALQIYEELGDGKIFFCDLPHTDKFTLTLFFALAEREALITSIRTKQALAAKKARNEKWDKNRNTNAAVVQSALIRAENARKNENNIKVWRYLQVWQKSNCQIDANMAKSKWCELSEIFNELGYSTATGLSFNANRLRAMYNKLCKLYL